MTGMEEGSWAETSTDPKGNITQKTYDRAGRLRTVTADGKTTTYKYYDSFSNTPSFMDAGTGMRISGIPDDFGRLNVSPINGADRGTAGVSKVGGKPEVFVRYGSEAEALVSKEGLVPKIQNGNPTKGAKWISEKAQSRDVGSLGKAKNYTYEMTIEAKPDAKQWLESKGINYEDMVGGESKNASNVILKSNEPGSYGIGADLLEEFNKNWVTNITYKKIR